MRSSAVTILAVAAASAPAFAAPTSVYTRSLGLDVAARDFDELAARSTLSDFAHGFEKGFTGTLETLAPLALSFLKREDAALAARFSVSDFAKGLAHAVETVAPIALDFLKREDAERLLARSTLSDFAHGFEKGFTGTLETLAPFALDFLKREDADMLLARSTLSDFAHGFEKGFTGTLETLGPPALSFLKREDLELLARSYLEMDVARSLNELD